jgi:phytanoyl-CoA hydroxylase
MKFKLTQEQVDSFHANGFLILDDFFNNKEISDFQHALRQLIRASFLRAKEKNESLCIEDYDDIEFHQGLMALEAIDHFFVADIYDSLAQTSAFKRLISKEETSDAINELMGKPLDSPLYTYTCRCRIDPPKDNRRTYGWHQEVFYSIPESDFLQTWAPLVIPTNEGNGTIEVCVGSHKEGIAKQTWNSIDGRATQIIVDDMVSQKYEQRRIDMTVGQMMIFDYRLFHQSGNNTSREVRYSLVGMYHDATKPSFYSANINFGYKKKTPKEYFNENFPASSIQE